MSKDNPQKIQEISPQNRQRKARTETNKKKRGAVFLIRHQDYNLTQVTKQAALTWQKVNLWLNEQQTRDRGKPIATMSTAGVTQMGGVQTLKKKAHGVNNKSTWRQTHEMYCNATRVQQGNQSPQVREPILTKVLRANLRRSQ